MPLPFAALIPLLAAGVSAGGAIGGAAIQRGQSRGDIERQNEYNHPAKQLARLREAGLPYAAYAAGQAGNQSALPQTTDGGLQAGANSGISSYITTQTALKQIELLKAEIRTRNAEADLKNAERDWLLSGKGEDRAGTNLTTNLKTQQEYSTAQTKGVQIANKIQAIVSENTSTRLQLENTKIVSEIQRIAKETGLISEHTKGAELDNKIKAIVASYQEGMSYEAFRKAIKENDLLDLNIEGKEIENGIQNIHREIEKRTAYARIYQTHNESLLSGLTYDRVKEEFSNYKQYMVFVKRVQQAFDREHITTRGERFNQILAAIYTSLTQRDGSNTLLNYVK